MKKLLSVIALMLLATTAFAQGARVDLGATLTILPFSETHDGAFFHMEVSPGYWYVGEDAYFETVVVVAHMEFIEPRTYVGAGIRFTWGR